jgi:hypothetical protein
MFMLPAYDPTAIAIARIRHLGRRGFGLWILTQPLPSGTSIGRTHIMLLAMDFRRQAQVCARLAEDCEDQRLAERFRKIATDLLAKADDFEGPPRETGQA